MPTLTIEQDKSVRRQLAQLAKSVRAKFSATAYQGDFANTVTGETFGDRLQVGTTATVNGTRYLLVLNLLIARNSGGKVSVRVSAWSLSGNTAVGTWPIKRTELTGVRLTPNGFVRRIGRVDSPVDMTARITTYLAQARANIKAEYYGKPVVTEHTDRNGDNPYDTTESHLLVFGGYHAAGARLAR
jgi:quinolinate synthase